MVFLEPSVLVPSCAAILVCCNIFQGPGPESSCPKKAPADAWVPRRKGNPLDLIQEVCISCSWIRKIRPKRFSVSCSLLTLAFGSIPTKNILKFLLLKCLSKRKTRRSSLGRSESWLRRSRQQRAPRRLGSSTRRASKMASTSGSTPQNDDLMNFR